MRVLTALTLSVLVLACSGTARRVESSPPPPPTEVAPEPEPEPEPTGPIVEEDTEAPSGPACTRSSECGGGLACRGAPGCTSPWACGTPRQTCGSEHVAYCDCDGVTFHAPASCPGRSYTHVGPCEDPGIADASYGLPDGDEPITERDRTCSSNSECRGGEICYGPPGCGMTWRCERVRGCMRGRRTQFCSCGGETFTAPPHCPGQPYTRRGACDEVIASTTTTSTTTSAPTATATPPATTTATTHPTPTTTTHPSAPTTTAATATTTATTTTTAIATTTTTTTATATATASRTAAPTTAPPLAPGTCRTNRDCARGEVCAGPAGCGDPWTCIHREERCNPDTQYFCDCEGDTFTASMTCPSRPYVHRGSCAIDQVIDLAGAALR